VNLFVDTSVWSLALRREHPAASREVELLSRALAGGEVVVTTGLVLQELLQGFAGPRSREAIVRKFSQLPVVTPELVDHIQAAELRNSCRRRGLQVGTIDALLAQLCIRHGFHLLTTDHDFARMTKHSPLQLA
jgi:hypothetical protein